MLSAFITIAIGAIIGWTVGNLMGWWIYGRRMRHPFSWRIFLGP